MDLATIIGFLGAFGIIGAAIVTGGDPIMFVNIPSLLIVFGGTLMVVMSKFGMSDFFGAVKVAAQVFSCKLDKPKELIKQSVVLASMARKGGILSLENAEVSNEFMQKGIQYLVDGLEAGVVRATLVSDMDLTVERHTNGGKIFKAIGDVAPAMGMIGTLIGLVQMLANMDDPKSIGPAMAVALLTTLYGAMIANMIAFPIADKLALRSQEEKRAKALLIDAVLAIQEGQNPRIIEEMLKTYLPGSKRELEDDGSPDAAG